jgi:hypothetical protein
VVGYGAVGGFSFGGFYARNVGRGICCRHSREFWGGGPGGGSRVEVVGGGH